MNLHLNEHIVVDDIDPDTADVPIIPIRQPSPTPSISSQSSYDDWDSEGSDGTDWSMYVDQIPGPPADPPILADEAGGSMPVLVVPPVPSVSNLQQPIQVAANPLEVLTYYQGVASHLVRDGISRDHYLWLRNQINQRVVEGFLDPDLVAPSDSSDD